MSKNLVIVESPAKAKTIEKFLGDDFTVRASYGHIRDLAKGDMAIDTANGFLPIYEISDDKHKLVAELKKLAGAAQTVWLATDEDREGEAIAWHLYEALGLQKKDTKRFVYHEVTKPAILKAIANPRGIDYNLVNAQQARRVLDRLVGFELSPVLWKKIKPALSAGRVQSVAVRLLVEREREINGFESSFAYRVTAEFIVGKDATKILSAELPKRFATAQDAENFLKRCIGADYSIKNLEVKPAKKSPAPPFTTSTLQQEASRKLGLGITQTMMIAQKLYEAGHITYMRTDSVNLSEVALGLAKDEITSAWGEKYSSPRKYTTKSSGAQEAHEAIRPTYFNHHTVDGDSGAKRLYDLIWKRSIASQMADAQLEKTVATISIHGATNQDLLFGNDPDIKNRPSLPEELVATGEVLKFDGFLKVYLESTDEETDTDESKMLPPLKIGELLDLKAMLATQKYAKPSPRYTEASLVKKLEELGIGRPSTYAPTISTIQKREYVVKEDREGKTREVQILSLINDIISSQTKNENYGAEKSKLFPTDIGNVVTDFLMEHFKQIMDYNFTAKVEGEFDLIADGKIVWNDMISEFYTPFHKTVADTMGNAAKSTGERKLGAHPETGQMISARVGRFGPMIQIGEGKEAKFASLRSDQSIETIELGAALELFKLPRIVGELEGKPIKVAIGRFGPYAQHDAKFTSLEATDDPFTITAERAIELILAKRSADSKKVIKEFPENTDVKVLNGKYGPYIVVGKQNVKIPKDKVPADLTLEECLTLAGADAPTAKNGSTAKPAAKKATKTGKRTV